MSYPKDLSDWQGDVREWSTRNFGNVPSWQPLLGIGEELGELNHAHLKAVQGIRGTAEEHRAAQVDAVGDILIYLLDYCSRENIDALQCLRQAWNEVSQRDWVKYPKSGMPAAAVEWPADLVALGEREVSQ